MQRAEATPMPSTWPATGELKVITSRVPKFKRDLASLRDSQPPVDRLSDALAIVDAEDPERPAFALDGAEPEPCTGCGRCRAPKTRASMGAARAGRARS